MKFSLQLAVAYLASFGAAAAIDTRADDTSFQKFKSSVNNIQGGLFYWDVAVKGSLYNNTIVRDFGDRLAQQGSELQSEPQLSAANSFILVGQISDVKKKFLTPLVTDLKAAVADVEAAGYCTKYRGDIDSFNNGAIWLLASITTRMPDAFNPIMTDLYSDLSAQLRDAESAYSC